MLCDPWPIDPDCIPEDWPEDPDVLARLLSIATEMLHAASGRTVGVCQYRVRPCKSDSGDLCQGICGCAPVCSVRIGEGQVQRVESILIDGEALPDDGWILYSDGTVVLTGGRCFPQCQDLSLPGTEPGTWEITYWEGNPPTPLAGRAVTALVAELARECATACGTTSRRLQSSNVEGESRVFDTDGGIGAYAGLPAVDDWLAVVNPNRATRQAAVFSPGKPKVWREVPR